MHPKFLDILCCPESGDSLELESHRVRVRDGMIVSGTLRSTSGRVYPIVRGVPRFVGVEHYASSFGYEWSRWPRVQFEDANVGRPMAGHTTRMWERITGVSGSLNGQTVVDFGCGPGRFLDVVRRRGGRAVGIDLSLAVESARRNFADDQDVLIVQGDLARPPFQPGSFDGGFTIGVLHHTPDPQRGLSAMARTLAPRAWAACCVYPKDDFYDFPSVARFRRLHHKLKPMVGYRFALAYSYFSAFALAPAMRAAKENGLHRLVRTIERNWLVCLRLKDPRWRLLDVFDAITPEMATTHTEAEVAAWMRAAGFENLRRTPWCPTSACGVKSAAVMAQAA
jgi:SAM-dependent methyltransferase